MAGIPLHREITGKIGSITISGRGANSGMLEIYVDGKIDGKSEQASPWVGCSDQPGETSCYPHIFQGYIDAAFGAQAHDREVSLLFYNIPDGEGHTNQIITALTVKT